MDDQSEEDSDGRHDEPHELLQSKLNSGQSLNRHPLRYEPFAMFSVQFTLFKLLPTGSVGKSSYLQKIWID